MDKIGLIDFQGQHDAQRYAQLSLIISAVLSFLVGFSMQNVHLTLYLFLVGVAMTFALTIPPWPFYKHQSYVWLENETKAAYQAAVAKLQAELDTEQASQT